MKPSSERLKSVSRPWLAKHFNIIAIKTNGAQLVPNGRFRSMDTIPVRKGRPAPLRHRVIIVIITRKSSRFSRSQKHLDEREKG